MKILKTKNTVRKYYQDHNVASTYEAKRFQKPTGAIYHSQEISIINETLALKQPQELLEIAVGPARIARHLKHFKHGTAFDSSPAMLSIARKHLESAKWRFVKGNAFKLPFKPNSFDAIISMRFVRHFGQQDRTKLYRGILNCLKPNGVFIMDAWNKEFTQTREVFNEGWTKEEIITEMQKNGFSEVKLKGYFFLSSLAKAKARYMQKNRPKKPEDAEVYRPRHFDGIKTVLLTLLDRLLKLSGRQPASWIVVAKK